MKIELRAVTAADTEPITQLEVLDSQAEYIAPNRVSLETAAKEEYRDIARPFAIYAEDEPVGFAMFAFDLASADPDDRYWLWRFMIDKRLQGNGYGAAALEAIVSYFKRHGADHILLSTKETNAAALSLYRRYHFAETGDRNGDEIVLRLNL